MRFKALFIILISLFSSACATSGGGSIQLAPMREIGRAFDTSPVVVFISNTDPQIITHITDDRSTSVFGSGETKLIAVLRTSGQYSYRLSTTMNGWSECRTFFAKGYRVDDPENPKTWVYIGIAQQQLCPSRGQSQTWTISRFTPPGSGW